MDFTKVTLSEYLRKYGVEARIVVVDDMVTVEPKHGVVSKELLDKVIEDVMAKLKDVKHPSVEEVHSKREAEPFSGLYNVTFSAEEWKEMERSFGKPLSMTEVKIIIKGIFSGEIKIRRS